MKGVITGMTAERGIGRSRPAGGNGEFNLFTFDPANNAVNQLTTFEDFPIINASSDGTDVIFEQAGYLHVTSGISGQSRQLTIGVAADLIETRPRYASGARFLRNAHISPSGARAVFEFRGEIVTVPAEKGDHRQLTHSSTSHERSPAWSPDGTKLAYTDNSWSLYVLDVESGRSTLVASEPTHGEDRSVDRLPECLARSSCLTAAAPTKRDATVGQRECRPR